MTGSVQITKANHMSRITSSHPFFSGEVVIKRTEDGIEFKKPTLDYVGLIHKGANLKSGWRAFSFNDTLPPGRWDFDEEESGEDLIVVKFTSNEAKEAM